MEMLRYRMDRRKKINETSDCFSSTPKRVLDVAKHGSSMAITKYRGLTCTGKSACIMRYQSLFRLGKLDRIFDLQTAINICSIQMLIS